MATTRTTRTFPARMSWAAAVLLPVAWLAGCGGGGTDSVGAGSAGAQPPALQALQTPAATGAPAAAPPTALAAASSSASLPLPALNALTTFPATCASLQGMVIAASSLTLSTRGAKVDTAEFIGSADAGNSFGAYCKLRGHISPVDTSAPVINFAVNLPNNWNFKAIHFGGAGFDGQLIDGTEKVRLSASSLAAPLAQGYATYGDDSGHQADTITDGSFALNDEALANFGRDALKKTHDVAYILMNARYGSTATRAYFLGTSTGGRDGLTYLQHWPADYDGAVVNQPALNYTGARLSNVATGRALYANGGVGWPSIAQTLLVQQRVLDTCDALDGLADGVVGNVEACRQKNAAVLDGLRCAGGAAVDDSCLSDAQLATIRTVASPLELRSYTLANSTVRSGGYNLLEGTQIVNGDRSFGTRAVPSTPPDKALDASQYFTGDQWGRYFIARNAAFDPLTLDPQNPGSYTARIQTVSGLTDASNPDLSAFFAHDGRLILVHGLADEVISTNSTIDYVQRLTAAVGAATVASHMRFYTVPGMGHGTGAFKPTWNSLDAIVAWAENGTAPVNPVVVDSASATAGRARPLCEYPSWPQYAGSGSTSAASSFSCGTAAPTPPACANLPATATSYKGGDTWGEELHVSIDPATLAYTVTIDASLQRSAGAARSGTLQPRGNCTYASQENGALFRFGAGGVLVGGVATPTGNNLLPLLGFASTSADYVAVANIYNASGVQYTGSTAAAWGGAMRLRSSAPTWQTCRDPSAGFIVYDAACATVTKGYIGYNPARAAFDLYTTPSSGGAMTTGGTLAGSLVAGLVNGQAVPLVLMRTSASSYGLRVHAPQASLVPGAADGAYTALGIAGDNRVVNLAGTVVHANASAGALAYDSPVAGVATSGSGYTGAFVFAAGLYGYGDGAKFELGLR
ncbi:MAG: tannase/feruloyl esterase family alpha/beta hydrolase [Pseudomonadota bacterium]